MTDQFAGLRAEIKRARDYGIGDEDFIDAAGIIFRIGTLRALLDAADERDRLAAALDDLSMMIRRLAHALPADSGLRAVALDLLARKGANSSPLRAAELEPKG